MASCLERVHPEDRAKVQLALNEALRSGGPYVCDHRALLPDGTIRLTGAAWGDGTPLKSVEVRIDDGPWLPAKVDRSPRDRYTWRFFTFDWKNPGPGEHQVVSRATDEEGRVQPAADDPAIALKKTYWEANQQWPRKLKLVTIFMVVVPVDWGR